MIKLPTIVEKNAGLKMGLFVIIAITAILFASGVIEYSISSVSLRADLMKTKESVSKRLAYNVAPPLWSVDPDGIMTIVKSEMEIADVSGVKLIDNSTKHIYGLTKHADGSLREEVPEESQKYISDTRDVLKDEKVIGVLTVFYNQDQLNQKMNTLIAKNGLTLIALDILIALILVLSIKSMFLKPLSAIHENTKYILSGDLTHKLEITSEDEFSVIGSSFNAMIDFLAAKAHLAHAIANGDLTEHLDVASPKDTLGKALQEMRDILNQLISEIREAGVKVGSESALVTGASASLAEGVAQSVASVEQISASLTEFSKKSENNAKNATETAAVAEGMREVATLGTQKIDEMAAAIAEISSLSGQIAKIIKTIDSIAFQTNLLALNASVEAARAGAHGKGFAVVADEVRNLASRSAVAAQETADLIEKTITAIDKGTSKVSATTASLKDLVNRSEKISELVADIARESREQSTNISQIVPGIGVIETITQKSMANSEETASCAQELTHQADKLNEILARFKLMA